MSEQLTLDGGVMRSSAVISECGHYRYRLERRWGSGSMCTFVMLNPSTADASHDDPTIRKCIGFAKRWGHDGFRVVNLFAYRDTSPAGMKCAVDPVGPLNDEFIQAACSNGEPVIVAWGNHGSFRRRDEDVLAAIRSIPAVTLCLGVTKSGQPLHPLMVAYDTPLIEMQC